MTGLTNHIAKAGLPALAALGALTGGWAQAQISNSGAQQPGTQAFGSTIASVASKATQREDDAYKAILEAQAGTPAHR